MGVNAPVPLALAEVHTRLAVVPTADERPQDHPDQRAPTTVSEGGAVGFVQMAAPVMRSVEEWQDTNGCHI